MQSIWEVLYNPYDLKKKRQLETRNIGAICYSMETKIFNVRKTGTLFRGM